MHARDRLIRQSNWIKWSTPSRYAALYVEIQNLVCLSSLNEEAAWMMMATFNTSKTWCNGRILQDLNLLLIPLAVI
eukprot:scaffold541601_cov19-Prasinocladus_malaysianus.AAC.1